MTLRARVTVVAGLAITAAVVLGVLLMYLLQMNAVHRTIDGELRTYATQLLQSTQDGRWPVVLPPSTLDSNAEAQVLGADGSVLAATRTLRGLPAIFAVPPGTTTPVRLKAADGVIPEEVRVVAVRTTVAGAPVTIVTGTATDLLHQVDDEFIRHLLIGLPLILVLSAGTVWLVVGRALRPVERIRHAVTAVTSADLSQRVPDPGTADEIGRLARTMNEMLGRIEAAAGRQRRFVADASHELRSPLAAIRTTLEVGLAHPDRAPWPTIAARAADQSVRLEELIAQLLLLARADEGLTAARRPIDLGPVLRGIAESTVTLDRDLRVYADRPVVVTGDAESLSRLFRNLVDNAIRHAEHTVTVTAVTAAGAAVVEVVDDGPGIAADERERVFDRFVRLDASRHRSTGSAGLGLSIARDIATAHHGRISITDAPGRGARVIVRLPLEPAEAEVP